MDRFSYSSAPIRRVKAIQFGVLDPDFLVRSRLSASYVDCSPASRGPQWCARWTCCDC